MWEVSLGGYAQDEYTIIFETKGLSTGVYILKLDEKSYKLFVK